MLKWCLCPASFIWHCLLLIRVASRSFSSICLFLNLAIHFSENLGIFRVALLFICQRSVILLLLLFSAATLISYHDRFRLSTTFFEIFSSFFRAVVLSRRCLNNESEYITPHITCQHYFLNFLHKLSTVMQIPHVQGIFTTFLFYFTKKGSFCPSCSIRYAR